MGSPQTSSAARSPLHTPLCDLLGIQHPVMLAGMNGVAKAELVAAVSNAGGIGTIGSLLMEPKILQAQIDEVPRCWFRILGV